MNILLLTYIKGAFPFIGELQAQLSKKGCKVSIIDVFDKRIINDRKEEILFPYLIRLLAKLPKFGFIFSLFYTRLYLFKHSKKIDVLNIHYFSYKYYLLFLFTNKYNGKIMITLWGSDMYRTTRRERKFQIKFLQKTKIVTVSTEQMKNDFLSFYHFHNNQIHFLRFGIGKFELIKKMMDENSLIEIKISLTLPNDKIIVACGYNGIHQQRHSLIIEALKQLPENFKNKLFLALIFGYGYDLKYLKEISNLLDESKFQYKIFDTFLSENEIAKYRIASDIVINIQTTDALSASLQEHFLAKNILIIGKWLPYELFDQNNLFYKKTSEENLSNSIAEVIIDLDNYKNKSASNSDKIYKLNSWESTIDDWIKTYNYIANA